VFRCDTRAHCKSKTGRVRIRLWLVARHDRSWICNAPRNNIYIRRMPSALRLQWEAAKDSTVRYHTDKSCARGSYYIFRWSGVYNCIRFISAFCNLLTRSPRSLMGNMLATGLRGAGFASGCNFVFFMVDLWNRADHYIFCPVVSSFFLLFFPRLISAVGDWMSTILPHMVWP